VADGALADVYGHELCDVIECVTRDQPDVRFFICAPSAAVKEKWLVTLSVGASLQRQAAECTVCTLCGLCFDNDLALTVHTCVPSRRRISSAAALPAMLLALEDVSSPDEVAQWLRADPDRRRAAELARKGVDKLAGPDKKQWDTLREMARSEKRKTLQGAADPEQPLTQSGGAPVRAVPSASASRAMPVPQPSSPRRLNGSIDAAAGGHRLGSPMGARRAPGRGPANSAGGTGKSDDEEEFIVYSATVSPRKDAKIF
jgi:hypothetical protein